MKPFIKPLLQMILLGVGLRATSGQAAEPAVPLPAEKPAAKMAPRPIPGMSSKAKPVPAASSQPVTRQASTPRVVPPVVDPEMSDRARILFIRRRSKGPVAIKSLADAKQIKASHAATQPPPEPSHSKIRIIPKAEVSGLLTPARPSPEEPAPEPSTP